MKSVGPWIDPWRTPNWTGNSCDDLPSRANQSCLLLIKEKIRPNIWPEIQLLKFVKKTSMPNSVESLGDLVVLSDKTVRRPGVDWEDLKLYWKSELRPHFSRWSTILLFTSFSKTLLKVERRLTGQ